jgi:small neutral amino acid transporter SnatA (MarC family)
MKLTLIAILAFAFAWLICYGAMRTAEKIVSIENRNSQFANQ